MVEKRSIKTTDISIPEASPLYYQIQKSLEAKIREGEYAPGSFLPPERDLAIALSVNRMTLRRALSELEKLGLLERKQGIGTIVKRPPRKKLRVGVIYYTLNDASNIDGFYGTIFYEINRHISDNNGRVLFLTVNELRSGLKEVIAEEDLTGIIMLGVMDNLDIRKTMETGIPVVLVDYFDKDLNLDGVVVDDFGGGYQATKHLIENGHKHIAYIGGVRRDINKELVSEASSKERHSGYLKALEDAGIKTNYMEEERISREGGFCSGETILTKHPEVTAFVGFDDTMAWGLYDAVAKLGKKIPEEISIVAFGDDTKFSNLLTPSLTTIDISDIPSLGKLAVEKLQYRIDNPNEQIEKISVATRLVKKDSVRNLK